MVTTRPVLSQIYGCLFQTDFKLILMLLFKVNLRINLLSKITHLTAIKNLKHTSRSLHLNVDNEICKPQKIYSSIFGQHDPGKTPMGKTSEEQIYYGDLKKKLQLRYLREK
jgi:hypothetical protein